MRRLWLLVLPAAAALYVPYASIPGGAPEGCPEGCASGGARRPGPLRVLTLNVLHGFPGFERLEERLALVAAEIRRLDADVVCLQEVPWTRSLGGGAAWLGERTGLNWVSLRANGNRWTILFEEGSAILSRFPLRDAGGRELLPRAGFFEHRIVLHARVVTPSGDLHVFSTHLTNVAAETNRAQTESLRAFVAERAAGPFVVAGDFNAREDSPQIRALSRSWVDSWAHAHPGAPGPTCCAEPPEAPAAALAQRIDYLFTAPGLRLRASRRVLHRPVASARGPLFASDHAGVFAELELRR